MKRQSISTLCSPKRKMLNMGTSKLAKAQDFLGLPNEIIFQVLSYFSDKTIFWNIGFSCVRLKTIALKLINIIDLCEENLNISKLHYEKLMTHKDIMFSIKHLWICSFPINLRKEVTCSFTGSKDKILVLDYRLFDNINSKQIGKNLNSLESLQLPSEHRYMKRLTNRSIRNVITTCKTLRLINLRKCRELDYTSNRSIISLIAEYCIKLQYIVLSGLRFDTSVIDMMFRNCNGLKVIFMNGCVELSDNSLIVMANHCPLVKSISLDNCINISDKSVTVVTHLCSLIEKFSLRNTDITNKSIKAIAFYCSKLTILNVANCYVTDNSLEFIATNCKKLQDIDLTGISGTISFEVMKMLTLNCPSLEKVHLGFINVNHPLIRDIEKRLYLLRWCTDSHLTALSCIICFPIVRELLIIAEEMNIDSEKLCIEGFIVSNSNTVAHCRANKPIPA